MKNIAIFASGTGTNAENIIRYFKDSAEARVAILFCNNPNAEVIKKADRLGIKVVVFGKKEFYESDKIFSILSSEKTDLIVLAGFLWLVPEKLIKAFPKRIINLHPALLPKFGGAGMYGRKVHEAVLSAGEKESGITIHYVDARFDEGEIILKEKCTIEKGETVLSLAEKIHQLEYRFYPEVIEKLLS